ncbi:MAG: amino acid transporter [Gemmataceae bacterium]|nr:amino acid transporter [Gemmataceae bacterium]
MPAPETPSGESTDPPSSSSDPPSRMGEGPPSGSPPQAPTSGPKAHQTAWPWVLCIVGLDYLSTLAYQPSIAFGAAGRLAPLVTVLVAAVTLFLALPVYWYIAGRSPHGGGSTALLEQVIHGWFGKLLILVLLSFGAVDLVFTRTFSAADAAEHLIHNPHPGWQHALDNATREGEKLRQGLPPSVRERTAGLWNRQMVVTLVVLVIGTVAGLVFFRGYTPGFVRLAVVTVAVYLALTFTVVGSGAVYLWGNPHLLDQWWADVRTGNWQPAVAPHPAGGWPGLVAACVPLFPYLALGLSGFELTLMAMPLVRGRADDTPEHPRGRIRKTRVLLVAASLTMSAYLLTSTLLTTVLIPPAALTTDGQAKYRALAYLAHGGALSDGTPAADINPAFGLVFGTIYDASTVAILALAGLSFALTLSQWIPPYLHRLGMEFNWSVRLGALIYLFTGVKIAVTVYYGADVDAHRAAYLTAVLAVFGFAAVAAAVDVWQKRRRLGWRKGLRAPPLFLLSALVFAASCGLIAWERTAAALLAGGFIVLVLGVSIVSRAWRCTEFRFAGFVFADKATEYEWGKLKASDFPILVPVRSGLETLRHKEIEIRTRHRIPGTVPIVFVHAELADPSDFDNHPLLRIARENGRVVVHITRCASVPHVLAAAALELSSAGAVPEVHFGWSAENPVTANLHFVLFGHGNVPWMVHTLVRRSDVPEDRKPRVIVG